MRIINKKIQNKIVPTIGWIEHDTIGNIKNNMRNTIENTVIAISFSIDLIAKGKTKRIKLNEVQSLKLIDFLIKIERIRHAQNIASKTNSKFSDVLM